MSRILVCVAAILCGTAIAPPADAVAEPFHATASELSHELVRTARHLRVRLERRVVFGARADRRALAAAATFEREAKRLHRRLGENARPASHAARLQLTRETRLAVDGLAVRLRGVRTGHYLEGEYAEARVLVRRLERLLGRPGRPHRPAIRTHAALAAQFAPEVRRPFRPSGAPGLAHRRSQPASSSLVPPVFHQ